MLTKILVPVTLSLLFFSVGCRQQPEDAFTEIEAKVFLDRYMETMNNADMDLIDKILSPDFVLHTPFFPEPLEGIDSYKNLVTSTSNAFSEFNATIDEVIVSGDRIWSRFSMEGLNTGPLGEIPATNRRFHIAGLAVTRVVDGIIVEDETYWNVLSLYQQLGFTLTPPAQEKSEQ